MDINAQTLVYRKHELSYSCIINLGSPLNRGSFVDVSKAAETMFKRYVNVMFS
jgi:hypothetical protein